MSAFLYGVALQWRLDIRSKSLLITCYLVPLLFFAVMGGIFTAILPGAEETLIPSMTVMGVSMGALIGLPPSLAEVYGSGCRKIYRANGVPLCLGLVSLFLSSFLHLLLMSAILYLAAPLAFGAALPANPPLYFLSLAVFIAVSLCLGCVPGLLVQSQSKLAMASQLLFLPSILLSGILFSASLLPAPLELAGKAFPAYWGYRLLLDGGFSLSNLWPLALLFLLACLVCAFRLRRLQTV